MHPKQCPLQTQLQSELCLPIWRVSKKPGIWKRSPKPMALDPEISSEALFEVWSRWAARSRLISTTSLFLTTTKAFASTPYFQLEACLPTCFTMGAPSCCWEATISKWMNPELFFGNGGNDTGSTIPVTQFSTANRWRTPCRWLYMETRGPVNESTPATSLQPRQCSTVATTATIATSCTRSQPMSFTGDFTKVHRNTTNVWMRLCDITRWKLVLSFEKVTGVARSKNAHHLQMHQYL